MFVLSVSLLRNDSCCDVRRAAVMVGLAQIEGKHVANKVVILPAEDGSSIGAACLASAAKAFLAARQQPNDGA